MISGTRIYLFELHSEANFGELRQPVGTIVASIKRKDAEKQRSMYKNFGIEVSHIWKFTLVEE